MSLEELLESSYDHPVLFFDGICKLCNGFIQLLLKYDKKGKIKMGMLQEALGKELQRHLGLPDEIETVIALRDGKIYTHSDVLLLIVKELGGVWSLIRPLYMLPKSFRDMVYRWIARNRYKWFGVSQKCYVPSEEHSSRFI